MTYSLVAVCPRTGQVGVAAMTAMVGVGKLVSWAESGVGAAASQAFMNPYLAIDGLRLLRDGVSAEDALRRLIDADPGKDGRQFGLVDSRGRSASWTGSKPEQWAGHRTGDGWACQGNRLVGPEVLDEAIAAFLAWEDRDLVDRLIHALDAGEDAGGDHKGHHSAGVTVLHTEQYPLWDLRVDHSDDPLRALHELHDVFADRLIDQIRKMPTRDNPMGEFDFDMEDGTV
jgi:uncharacterized Ntn-hydrolase superfamily protein